MKDRVEFHRRRQTGIGGSDVGAIVGVDPYRNALDVYLEKVGEVPPREDPLPIQERGHYLEDDIRDLFKAKTGRRLKPARFRRHREHKWMIGHPDSLIGAREPIQSVFDERGILECKSMSRGVFKQIVERGVPQHIQLQDIHYATLCGHRWAATAIVQPDTWQFIAPEMEVDPAIQKQVIEICEHFWYNHVVPQNPPAPVEPEWKIELPAVEGVVEDRHDPEWRATIERIHELKLMRDEAEELYEAAREELRELCGRYGVFEGAGARVYFKLRERMGGLDTKRLAAAGLLDPAKVQAWLGEVAPPLLRDLTPELAAQLRADVDQFRKAGTQYKDLRLYHVADQGGA